MKRNVSTKKNIFNQNLMPCRIISKINNQKNNHEHKHENKHEQNIVKFETLQLHLNQNI